MKKFILLLALCLIFIINAFSQPSSYRGGSFHGIYGTFLNPANIASNPRKWDVNLISTEVTIANNEVKLGISDLNENFEDELFKSENQTISGLANIDVIGPSLMFRLNPRHSIAITTRSRVLINMREINSKLAEAIVDGYEINNLPYNINSGNQNFTINGWSEIGASWGGVILNKGKHILKSGVTVKYLRGVGNSFVDIENLNATLNVDLNDYYSNNAYLTDGTGNLYLVNSGIDLLKDNYSGDDLTGVNGSGIGFDIGFIYEFKDNVDSSGWSKYCINNGYKFKVGLAILDIGRIKYKSNDSQSYHYNLNIPAGERLYLNELDGSIDEIENYLDNSTYAEKIIISESYSPSLPTTLKILTDYYWGGHFFTELSGNISLIGRDSNTENSFSYNSISFVPRYEGKYGGICLPYSYNTLSKFNLGLTLRAGPLMIGSSTIISNLLDESKAVNIFVGLRFGL